MKTTSVARSSGRERANGSGPGAPGAVGRVRALPGSRAVAGGFLIAAAVVVVFAAWMSATRHSGQSVVVARSPLAAGARLRGSDLQTTRMHLSAGAGGAAYGSPDALAGRILAVPVRPGELLESGDLVPVGAAPGHRPVTVAVAQSDLSGLQVGQLVDVLVTEGTDPASPTRVVVTGATLLQTSGASSGLIGGSTGAQATLGVSSLAQVEAVVHGAHTGTLSIVAGEPADATGPGTGGSGATAGGGR